MRGAREQLWRCGKLEEDAVFQNADGVSRHQGFRAVSGEEKGAEANGALELFQQGHHARCSVMIQSAEWAVQDKHFRPHDECARQLAPQILLCCQAGGFKRAAAIQTHERQCFRCAALTFRRGDLSCGPEGEQNIVR
ncbi:hypothetical protein AA14337_1500 [Acetobacter malorum DSM 14337]|uniref:Uncharacterized protein n=1 Tax=Acetobacter malorum DSM 14337 TaxID=1307910 RepID=A0ABQ0PT21_9PROT|nr:hypothetical protein AA14337_1500 [Acetobacter malorum DSM 14337]